MQIVQIALSTLLLISAFAMASSATNPIPRQIEYDWMSISQWYHKHADDVAIAKKGDVDILFIGDSITESWEWDNGHDAVFKQLFGNVKSANFGIGGDQTQHVLWRLQNSLVGNLSPKVAILMIGVNNLGNGQATPEATAKGVRAVVEQVHANYPNAKILLHAILPYDQFASSPNRTRVNETNRIIKTLGKKPYVYYYNFGNVFLDKEGNIPVSLMGDFLHPTANGLAKWGKKLQPAVETLLQLQTQEK